MKTVSLGVENLCVPCHAHCKYCLLSSCGTTSGVSYERGKRFASRLYHEAQEQRPDLNFYHYIGFCMDSENLMDYIAFSAEIRSPSANFLQLNGLKLRSEADTDSFIAGVIDAGVKVIDLTFYGMKEYHDRFAGRAGDFEYLLRILKASQKFGLEVHISIPVTKENKDEIDELLTYLDELHGGEISLFLPHGKGRGKYLDALRLTSEDLSDLSARVVSKLSAYKTEREWLRDACGEMYSQRTLVLALTSDEIDRLESMSLEDIISYLEALDDDYYAAIPSCDELANLYGDRVGTRLYRRFRDLHLEWQRRYLSEHNIDIWDMNDETHHFSVRT